MHRIDRLEFWKILFVRVQFPFTPQPRPWHVPREDQLRARGERGEEGSEEVAVSSYQLVVISWVLAG